MAPRKSWFAHCLAWGRATGRPVLKIRTGGCLCRRCKPPDWVTDHFSMAFLDQLQWGQRARVIAVEGSGAVVQRLLEMGLLEGEEIEVIGFAPLGDPIEIRLRDYRLSLRRSEAARIQVTPQER